MSNYKLVIGISLLILSSCSKYRPDENRQEQTNQNYFQSFTDHKGFSLEFIKNLHENFDYDERTYVVGGGGDHSRYIFLNTNEFFFNTTIKKGQSVINLPLNLRPDVSNFITKTNLGELPLKDYVKDAPVDGLIILHKGQVVFEAYPRMFWNDKHIWFSVSKTLTSTAVAILEDREIIDTDEMISTYLSELKGTGWENISVRNILDMSSGMDAENVFEEDATFWKYLSQFGGFTHHLQPGSKKPIEFFRFVDKLKEPGLDFEYSDLCTQLLNWLVEQTSGERFSSFIEREIWKKGGMDFSAHFITTMNGDCFSGAGMNSTLRDLARFGMMFVPSGRSETDPMISDRYLYEIRYNYNENLKTTSWYSEEQKYNSYQWDEVYPNGDFIKDGINGQGLYISHDKDLVIAFFGTRDENQSENQLPLISRQLSHSGLFD